MSVMVPQFISKASIFFNMLTTLSAVEKKEKRRGGWRGVGGGWGEGSPSGHCH